MKPWPCTAANTPAGSGGTSITLPKIIHDCSDAEIIDDQKPLFFGDEARAYMFAEVAEYVFPVTAQVIETPAGWAVSVSNEKNGLDAETLVQLQGACRVSQLSAPHSFFPTRIRPRRRDWSV